MHNFGAGDTPRFSHVAFGTSSQILACNQHHARCAGSVGTCEARGVGRLRLRGAQHRSRCHNMHSHVLFGTSPQFSKQMRQLLLCEGNAHCSNCTIGPNARDGGAQVSIKGAPPPSCHQSVNSTIFDEFGDPSMNLGQPRGIWARLNEFPTRLVSGSLNFLRGWFQGL